MARRAQRVELEKEERVCRMASRPMIMLPRSLEHVLDSDKLK